MLEKKTKKSSSMKVLSINQLVKIPELTELDIYQWGAYLSPHNLSTLVLTYLVWTANLLTLWALYDLPTNPPTTQSV